jgi:hypothetical protein
MILIPVILSTIVLVTAAVLLPLMCMRRLRARTAAHARRAVTVPARPAAADPSGPAAAPYRPRRGRIPFELATPAPVTSAANAEFKRLIWFAATMEYRRLHVLLMTRFFRDWRP